MGFRVLMVLMMGICCFWGFPGCGEEEPEVVPQKVVMPDMEEGAVVEAAEGEIEEEEAESEEAGDSEESSKNIPPSITDAKIVPFPARSDTDIRVEVEAEDPDNDWVNYAYQWVIVREGGTIDDLEELEGQTGDTLSHDLFSRGDAVAVQITPSDWYDEGVMYQTKLMVIPNTPPEIVSSPSGASSDLYTYQVVAEDPDKDTIIYGLEAGSPVGMSIDAATGLLTWDTSKAKPGEHAVRIKVHDGQGGNSFQRFVLTISSVETQEEGVEAEEMEGTEEGEETEAVEEDEEAEETDEW